MEGCGTHDPTPLARRADATALARRWELRLVMGWGGEVGRWEVFAKLRSLVIKLLNDIEEVVA